MILYVVGKFISQTAEGQNWELQGVFTSEALAEAACHTETHFIGPVQLNAPVVETVRWEGVRFPRREHEV